MTTPNASPAPGAAGATDRIRLRPAAADDQGFLKQVFFDVAGERFLPLGLDGQALEALLGQQYRARQIGYGNAFPHATTSVILVDGDPAGEIIVCDEHPGEAMAVRVVSITVLNGLRSRGIGAAVLTMVIADARERGAASVRLSVQVDNAAARRLYQRLGFVADPAPDEAEAVAAFVEMHRPL